MWIWIANKLAKFHAKRLNRSENIPKSFRGGGYFFETPCRHVPTSFDDQLMLNYFLMNQINDSLGLTWSWALIKETIALHLTGIYQLWTYNKTSCPCAWHVRGRRNVISFCLELPCYCDIRRRKMKLYTGTVSYCTALLVSYTNYFRYLHVQ